MIAFRRKKIQLKFRMKIEIILLYKLQKLYNVKLRRNASKCEILIVNIKISVCKVKLVLSRSTWRDKSRVSFKNFQDNTTKQLDDEITAQLLRFASR